MNTIENVEKAICNGEINRIEKQHLMLAYLQLAVQNPCLHPDDHMFDGGYKGWQVLLVDKVWSYDSLLPMFRYPAVFLQIEHVLKDLGDADYVQDITYWLSEFDPAKLANTADMLQKLYLHHADENDDKEAEDEKFTAVLRDCADVLTWIQQQK